MSALRPSNADVRRAVQVGWRGVELGLDTVPGVVLADVRASGDDGEPWTSPTALVVHVWGGEPARVWARMLEHRVHGWTLVAQVWPVSRWARLRAWWRWATWPLVRWLDRGQG